MESGIVQPFGTANNGDPGAAVATCGKGQFLDRGLEVRLYGVY